MAGDAQKVIELIFQGVDKTGAATQAAISNTKSFADNLQNATQPIADFTASAVKVEAGLLAAGVAVTAFSVAVASDFQSAAADLNKVLSDTDDLEQYKDLALELGQAYGVSATDVLNAITNYKQAGFTAKEAADLTKSGLDLVIAGGVEAATAAELLVASIKGFGAEASIAAPLVDLLNSVSNEYATNVQQLLEGFSILSPVASKAGLSLEETIGILTPGIEVFRSGAEVANALRTVFIALTDDTDTVQNALKELGVSQTDANGELRSARDIYYDVAAALGELDQNQQIYIASSLVGKNRTSQFLAVVEGLDKTLRIAGDGFEYLGSAAKEVEIQLGTAEVAGNRVKTSFTNLLIAFGSPLLDEFSGSANALVGIFAALAQAAEQDGSQVAELVGFIEDRFGDLRDTLLAIAQNLPAALEQADLSGFSDGVAVVVDALADLFDGVDLTSVEGLTTVITFAGEAFESLSQFTAGVIDSLKPLFNLIRDTADGFQELNPELFRAVGEFAGFATQANKLAASVTSLLPALEGLVAIIGINQAVGLVGALVRASGALSGGTGLIALLGQTGLVGAAGGAGFAIGTLANKATELATGTSISTWLVDTAISLGILDDEATNTVESMNLLEGTVGGAGTSAEESAAQIAAADAAMAGLAGATDDASQKVYNFSTGMFEIVDAAETQAGALDDSVATLYDLSGALEDAGGSFGTLEDNAEQLGGTFSIVKNEFADTAKSLKETSDLINEISLEEKLALIEAQSAITVAGIQASAEKTVAAYESISTSIVDTGDSLRSLFGLLGDENISKLDKLDIERQIELENERREEAFRLQERLTNAQIKEALARAEAFQRGQAAINIDGAGLQPHLEAFMFEILSAIQVRVNQDGYELLLGAA